MNIDLCREAGIPLSVQPALETWQPLLSRQPDFFQNQDGNSRPAGKNRNMFGNSWRKTARHAQKLENFLFPAAGFFLLRPENGRFAGRTRISRISRFGVQISPVMQPSRPRKPLSIFLAGSLLLPAGIATAAECDFLSADFLSADKAQAGEVCTYQGIDGFTPLHWAASSNPDPAVIAALLNSGAAINGRAEDGSTPLHWAAAGNPNPAVVAALLSFGADIDSRTEHGLAPLHWAAFDNPNPAIIAALLSSGADVNSRDEDGSTPLHDAAFNNPNPAVIAALLEAGADVNSRDGTGRTPLHDAAFSNPNPEVVSALLAAGADPKLTSNAGQTVWYYARQNPKLKDTAVYRKLRQFRRR